MLTLIIWTLTCDLMAWLTSGTRSKPTSTPESRRAEILAAYEAAGYTYRR